MKHELTCIVCPQGCRMALTDDPGRPGQIQVTGCTCQRGRDYAVQEVTAPCRTLTSTVRITGARLPRLPVRTRQPIPKERLTECMALIDRLIVASPVAMGQVLVADLFGTGIPLVASRSL